MIGVVCTAEAIDVVVLVDVFSACAVGFADAASSSIFVAVLAVFCVTVSVVTAVCDAPCCATDVVIIGTVTLSIIVVFVAIFATVVDCRLCAFGANCVCRDLNLAFAAIIVPSAAVVTLDVVGAVDTNALLYEASSFSCLTIALAVDGF